MHTLSISYPIILRILFASSIEKLFLSSILSSACRLTPNLLAICVFVTPVLLIVSLTSVIKSLFVMSYPHSLPYYNRVIIPDNQISGKIKRVHCPDNLIGFTLFWRYMLVVMLYVCYLYVVQLLYQFGRYPQRRHL